MNELHITNWYPNLFQPHEAPFIQAHFQGIPASGRRELWHVQVRPEGGRFQVHRGRRSEDEHFLLLDASVQPWRLIEVLHLVLLTRLRAGLGKRWWDVVVVHIAYPLLRFVDTFRRLFGDEVVIVEHWSAFHSGFHLADGSAGRRRIQRIFQQGLPVVAVSQALLEDIERFAEIEDLSGYVVPNVVDPVFCQDVDRQSPSGDPVFVMIGNWAPIKRPLLIFEAFRRFLESGRQAQLRVIGYGVQMEAMKAWVSEHGLDDRIRFLGAMDKPTIARQLQKADALLHASDYETFSVVCAEAIACGTPVLASDVGGISEFIDERNGLLVLNEADHWADGLQRLHARRDQWDREAIAKAAHERFSREVVGAQLADVLRRYARAA